MGSPDGNGNVVGIWIGAENQTAGSGRVWRRDAQPGCARRRRPGPAGAHPSRISRWGNTFGAVETAATTARSPPSRTPTRASVRTGGLVRRVETGGLKPAG